MKIKQFLCRVFIGHRFNPNDTIVITYDDGKNIIANYKMQCRKCGYEKNMCMNMPSIFRRR